MTPAMFRPVARMFALGVAVWLTATLAASEEMTVDHVIESRQRNLRDMGAAYKSIGDQLKRGRPNLSEMAQYASSLNELAMGQKHWFPEGSGPESGVDTAAKAEIWLRPEEFRKWEDELVVEVAKLVKVTAGQDIEAVRRQHQQVGKVCAGCHKPFRVEED